MTGEPPPKPTKNDYHVERSRFLDAFAALEETLNRPCTAISDEALLTEIKALRLVRNDLVHAQLRFVALEGQLQAIVINSKEADTPARPARVLRLTDFQSLASELARLKKSVEAA